jgi:hypothetical protein
MCTTNSNTGSICPSNMCCTRRYKVPVRRQCALVPTWSKCCATLHSTDQPKLAAHSRTHFLILRSSRARMSTRRQATFTQIFVVVLSSFNLAPQQCVSSEATAASFHALSRPQAVTSARFSPHAINCTARKAVHTISQSLGCYRLEHLNNSGNYTHHLL